MPSSDASVVPPGGRPCRSAAQSGLSPPRIPVASSAAGGRPSSARRDDEPAALLVDAVRRGGTAFRRGPGTDRRTPPREAPMVLTSSAVDVAADQSGADRPDAPEPEP